MPEQSISDGKGTLYVVLQDSAGSVAVVDQKAMKTTAHYPFGDVGQDFWLMGGGEGSPWGLHADAPSY